MMLHKFIVTYVQQDNNPQPFAEFTYDDDEKKYIFSYLPDAKFEFPGFPKGDKPFVSKTLFEPISFRIPNYERKVFGEGQEIEILKETKGRLATDQFSFVPV